MAKIITANFTQSGLPQLGLTPTITIIELDPTSPTTNVTVVSGAALVEVGMGWYRYNFTGHQPTSNYVFTIDGGSSLSSHERYKVGGNESYSDDAAFSVWNEPTAGYTTAGSVGLAVSQIQADVSSMLISEIALSSLLNTLLKYERNRTKIDLGNSQLIIYDDDGTTPLTRFNLKDFNGMPSVQEVCERVPVI